MWQPWATLCVAPYLETGRPPKVHETRAFAPRASVPIDVAIHATKKWDSDNAWTSIDTIFRVALNGCGFLSGPTTKRGVFADPSLRPLPLGAIIGVATIVRVHTTEFIAESLDDADSALGDFSPGRYAWRFANTVLLPEPIPFKGRQDVLYLLDPSVQAAIDRQLAPPRIDKAVADAWNKGEDKYRVEVLGQRPLL